MAEDGDGSHVHEREIPSFPRAHDTTPGAMTLLGDLFFEQSLLRECQKLIVRLRVSAEDQLFVGGDRNIRLEGLKDTPDKNYHG